MAPRIGKKRERSTGDAIAEAIKDVLDGAYIRALAEITDQGEVILAKVGHWLGGQSVEVDDEIKEIRVFVQRQDGAQHPFVGRLHVPANALWRKPTDGAQVHVIRGQNTPMEGALVLFGEGDVDAPASLTDTNTVVSPPTGQLVLESRDQNVDLQALESGKTVNVAGDQHPLPKFDTFETALANFLDSLSAQLALGTAGSPVKQQLVGLAAIQTLVTNFKAALTGGNYDSTKAKNG